MKKQSLLDNWTSDPDSLVYFLLWDFLDQIETRMERKKISCGQVARKMKIPKGALNAIFDDPGKASPLTLVKLAKAVGLKVTLLAYDDSDPGFKKAPVLSCSFLRLWKGLGRPRARDEIDAFLKKRGKK